MLSWLLQYISFTQEAEVRRIVVDIGNGIHDQERRQIASNYRSVVRVSGYGDLYTKLEDVMKLACDQQYPGKFVEAGLKCVRLFIIDGLILLNR